MIGAAQTSGAPDTDGRRPAAADLCAHLAQELAELDNVGLRRRVTQLRLAGRGGSRQERGLGSRDGRLVQIDGGATKPAVELERVPSVLVLSGAHRHQRIEVGRNRAAGRKVAAGRRQAREARACQERTEYQDRAAELADEAPIGFARRDAPAANAERRRAEALDFRTDRDAAVGP